MLEPAALEQLREAGAIDNYTKSFSRKTGYPFPCHIETPLRCYYQVRFSCKIWTSNVDLCIIIYVFRFAYLFIHLFIYIFIHLSRHLFIYYSVSFTLAFYIGSKDLPTKPRPRPCQHTGRPHQQGGRNLCRLHLQTRIQVSLKSVQRLRWILINLFFEARVYYNQFTYGELYVFVINLVVSNPFYIYVWNWCYIPLISYYATLIYSVQQY